jgi:chaperonin GroEL (HSP60 family)
MSTNLATGKSKKPKQLSEMIGYVINSLQGIREKDEDQEFIKLIYKARQEMQDAQTYFDNVTDPELVDHAIYKMEAAKSQYVYLLRLAKDKGLSVSIGIY